MKGHVDSWYARTGGPTPDRAPLQKTVKAEVCVIGGGLAGIATALDLAERGRSVALLESHSVGWGASGRNGGFVTPGFPNGAPDLVAKVGLHAARELYDLNLIAHRLVRSRIDAYHIDCGHTAGQVRCALASSRESLEAYCAMMARDFRFEFEYWPRQRLAEAVSSPKYGEAFYNPYTFAVDPLALTRGLARAAETHGARIYENSPATALEIDGINRCVRTPHGKVIADHIVLACGGHIGGLHRTVGLATVPIATFVMVTEPLGDRLRDAIRVPHAISDITLATNYYRPLDDGRLLWGGRVLAWEPSPARIASLLRRDMVSFHPSLAGTRVEVAWSGLMPYLRHEMPVVGQIKKGVWYATGFGGLGLALTTMAGQMIGAAIDQNDDRWRLLARFGLPFAAGKLGRVPAQMAYWYDQAKVRFGLPT